MVRLVRRFLRKHVELTLLRMGILISTGLCVILFVVQKSDKTDLHKRYSEQITVTVKSINEVDVPREPAVINSWPSRHWGYRTGNISTYLTIAIPSVRRPNTRKIYLYETLESIIKNTDMTDRSKTRVIVFLIDFNYSFNVVVNKTLVNKFGEFISSGFISIVCVNNSIYPDLSHVKRTFNDSSERLKWRAKQNIDFAYMFWYSHQVSEYYLQLEDDVIVASNFVKDIHDFVNFKNESWFLIEFSKLGFIGKLFKSKDLKWSANFLFKRYDVAPCDLLLGAMRNVQHQMKPIHSNTSLFQHIGKFSSLQNKLMPSIDRSFKDIDKLNLSLDDYSKGVNPPAKIVTNIEQYENYHPLLSYDGDAGTFFWGKSQNKQDFLKLIFDSQHNFSKIIISTGDAVHRNDNLRFGELRYSLTADDDCKTAGKLVDFVDGEIDTIAQGIFVPNSIKCLLICVKKRSRSWLIIRRIELFI